MSTLHVVAARDVVVAVVVSNSTMPVVVARDVVVAVVGTLVSMVYWKLRAFYQSLR